MEVRSWPAAPPAYGEAQRVPHWEIGEELGMLDMERGAKLVRLDVPPLPRASGPGCCGR